GDGAGILVRWQTWQPAVFEQARLENKLVLLNMEAVWCHWCHVMDEKTYSDPAVAEYLHANYIPILVDHDARPDLANRYREYGWPATIVLKADGTELVKRAGYIAPANFLRLLQAIVADPTPEAAARIPTVTAAENSNLPDDIRTDLQRRHLKSFDPEKAGLAIALKFLEEDHVEWAMTLAAKGDAREEDIARRSIEASFKLIDPVWGGVYQYSTRYDWDHPHYEKIMSSQMDYLRIYALAYAQWQDERYKNAAYDVYRYLTDFLLSPNGAFYTSQDADLRPGEHSDEYFALDDAGRRAQGVPRIDKHLYTRENAWVVTALAHLYAVTGDEEVLNTAKTAMRWVVANRRLPEGGFKHDAEDEFGPFLGDTLAMGRAYLLLHQVTAKRVWLVGAENAANFIAQHFKADNAGYLGGVATGGPVKPIAHVQENIRVVRFTNRLFHYTGKQEFRDLAEHGMRYLVAPEIATKRIDESGILLADHELAIDPKHLAVVGPKSDAAGRALFALALRQPGAYKRVEWWDRAEGPLPNPDVRYPKQKRVAAYYCNDGRCSLPTFTVARFAKLIAKFDTAK
ncbi:MAG: DUF255 domain-containing protein, partial [Gammaproteobacteria bacterium]